jgi:DNA primase catalytic core
MARIPAAELERLKAEVSVQRLAEARGVKLRRHGADLIGLCPFHDDTEPSLVISPKKNLWHCLGACQAGGSVIDWVMKAEGVSFRHAVALLREGFSPLAAAPRVKRATVPKLAAPVVPDADDQALLDQVIDYYHATLKASAEALAYLERRGIGSAEAIERFKLGYANRTLGLRLPDKNRKAGAEIRGRLQKLGLLRASGHEHFNGSLIIPVLDEHGHVTEIYGRKILDNLRAGTAYHLYLPGPHRGVWNVEALAASPEIILCEALIDALTFWCAGYRHVTAAYGVEGFTADHLAAFKRYGTGRVLIAYDRDAAGDAAASALAKRLAAEGLACYRVLFPKGMDANAYALKVAPAAKSLGVVLRAAEWLGQGPAPARAPVLDDDAATAPPAAGSASALVADPSPVATAEVPSARDGSTADETIAEPLLPASPMPALPPAVEAKVTESEVLIELGDRRYRVRGLEKNLAYDLLRVNVLVARGAHFHVDTLDLYAARARAAYIHQAAAELGVSEEVVKKDLGQVLLKLEALQDAQIKDALAPKSETVTLTEAQTRAALALLKAPDLIPRIAADIEAIGLVGESTNALVGYLACVSRLLERPLALLLQSASAAGKSSLMEAVLSLVPEEDRVQYSALTGQALFYLGHRDLRHKVLAIAEEHGAAQAAYALKLLQSEGVITIASTGKDAATGALKTEEYRVEGPVMLCLTTTAIDIDEELLNRCLVLAVNESRAQTQAIHARQRRRQTLAGLLAEADREALLALHRNAQRLLRPLAVVNPYAEHLTFLDDRTRTRRDHEKYLTLIRAIALLHQHQRPIKSLIHRGRPLSYIEATAEDIALANRLAHTVLGRTLDELPPQTRRLLAEVQAWVAERCTAEKIAQSDFRFTRWDVRTLSGWGHTQVRVHLERLAEMEYLLVHRGGRGQRFVYELLYDGDPAREAPHLMGLLDPEQLSTEATTASSRGSAPGLAGSKRPEDGALAGPWRTPESAASAGTIEPSADAGTKALESELKAVPQAASHRSAVPVAAKA